METTPPNLRSGSSLRLLNKVPEVTVYFWVIKVLCTTVGETAADYLNTNLDLGLEGTGLLMAALLAAALVVQFRARKYVPGIYWLAVVLISVVGTLLTDFLTDTLNVPLKVSTLIFAVALAATFGAWFAVERTLSIHAITTSRREGFYWLAILFTFALGTAAGDLVAERFDVGYWPSAMLFAAAIAAIALSRYGLRLNAVLAFWGAYILTRPLGASLGDFLSQSPDDGGLGLGTTGTSVTFLAVVLVVVVYLTLTRKDAAEKRHPDGEQNPLDEDAGDRVENDTVALH
ncbi:hypothetical protein V3C33_13065 [Micrococcaceae bacterium Sec5.7]